MKVTVDHGQEQFCYKEEAADEAKEETFFLSLRVSQFECK